MVNMVNMANYGEHGELWWTMVDIANYGGHGELWWTWQTWWTMANMMNMMNYGKHGKLWWTYLPSDYFISSIVKNYPRMSKTPFMSWTCVRFSVFICETHRMQHLLQLNAHGSFNCVCLSYLKPHLIHTNGSTPWRHCSTTIQAKVTLNVVFFAV